MAKHKIIQGKQLGPHCWAPHRFITDGRCAKVIDCTYPEKEGCKAVEAEIQYLQGRCREVVNKTNRTIMSLKERRAPT